MDIKQERGGVPLPPKTVSSSPVTRLLLAVEQRERAHQDYQWADNDVHEIMADQTIWTAEDVEMALKRIGGQTQRLIKLTLDLHILREAKMSESQRDFVSAAAEADVAAAVKKPETEAEAISTFSSSSSSMGCSASKSSAADIFGCDCHRF